MATVSHLPHVLANLLAGQAAAALSDDSERMPEVGPSFRDATRVAGSNPAIWGDILTANREAVAAAIDDAVTRLREARELIRSGEAGAVAAWHAAAGADRRRLLEPELAAGPLRELRVVVANRRGRGQHRGHGAAPGGRHEVGRDHALGGRRGAGGAGGGAGPRAGPHRQRPQ
jgi:prephenate dehydrogenase